MDLYLYVCGSTICRNINKCTITEAQVLVSFWSNYCENWRRCGITIYSNIAAIFKFHCLYTARVEWHAPSPALPVECVPVSNSVAWGYFIKYCI